jgi:hypothetical protein
LFVVGKPCRGEDDEVCAGLEDVEGEFVGIPRRFELVGTALSVRPQHGKIRCLT